MTQPLLLPAPGQTSLGRLDSVSCCDALVGLRALPSNYVNCIVTSPPYWNLRDYGVAGQIGLEESPGAYVKQMTTLFSEARRTLRDDGTLWLNLGSTYSPGYIESDEMELRDNLTPDELRYVLGELAKYV